MAWIAVATGVAGLATAGVSAFTGSQSSKAQKELASQQLAIEKLKAEQKEKDRLENIERRKIQAEQFKKIIKYSAIGGGALLFILFIRSLRGGSKTVIVQQPTSKPIAGLPTNIPQ